MVVTRLSSYGCRMEVPLALLAVSSSLQHLHSTCISCHVAPSVFLFSKAAIGNLPQVRFLSDLASWSPHRDHSLVKVPLMILSWKSTDGFYLKISNSLGTLITPAKSFHSSALTGVWITGGVCVWILPPPPPPLRLSTLPPAGLLFCQESKRGGGGQHCHFIYVYLCRVTFK